MKYLFGLSMVITASIMIGCGGPAANNATGNTKPPNASSNTAAASDPKAAEADVRKLMADAAAALGKNDADAMDKIYADNYMLVNTDGSVQTRAERLASLRSGEAKYTSFSYSDADIRVSPGGDDAVVIAKLSMKGTFKGKANDGDFRVTQVYAKTKDGWKQISAQATKIDASVAKDDKKLEKEDAADKMPSASKSPVPPK